MEHCWQINFRVTLNKDTELEELLNRLKTIVEKHQDGKLDAKLVMKPKEIPLYAPPSKASY